MGDFIDEWGKYRIKRLIAKGGMAEVFEAEITGPAGFSKPVCLKRIRPEFMSDANFIKMFQAEALIAAKLHHPNIVAVFDFDMHEGCMFLVMEYVEGWNLKKLSADFNGKQFRPPAGFAVYVMDSLLAALNHAHTRCSADGKPEPVIHRDVSPHNVLISTDGIVKLADFGIAKSGGISGPTTIGVVKGKLAYLAPEQLRGFAASISSDLYSAGLVMLEIMKGARPVELASDGAALRRASFQFSSSADIPEQLNLYLAALLAPSPDERFQNAAAAREALKNTGIAPISSQQAAALIPAVSASPSRPPAPQRTKEREAPTRIATEVAPKAPRAETMIMPSSPELFASPMAAARPHRAGTVLSPSANRSSGPSARNARAKAASSNVRKSVVFALAALAVAAVIGVLVIGKILGTRERTSEQNAKRLSNMVTVPTVAQGSVKPDRSIKPIDVSSVTPPPSPPPALDSNALSLIVVGSEPKLSQSGEHSKTQRRVKEPAPKTDGDPSVQNGFLSVNVNPWAEVFVDGESKGTTPIQKLSLSEGPHTVRLENKVLGYTQTSKVTIQPDAVSVLTRDAQRKIEASSDSPF